MPKRSDLEDMDDAFLLCRVDNHPWTPPHDDQLVYSRGYLVEFRRFQTCTRCGRERTELIEVPSFAVKKATSLYPDGFLSAQGRLHVTDIRREQVRRLGKRFKADK